MPSPIVTRVLSAIAGALAIELANRILDAAGISEEKARITRTMVAAAAAALAGAVIEILLRTSQEQASSTSS
jgi:ABC-type uncharacterized transport system permease subunit